MTRSLRLWPVLALLCSLGLFLSACAWNEEGQLVVLEPTSTPAPSPTPVPVYYTVQPGETLWTIAQKYNISVDDLIRVNELDDPNRLEVGRELLISDRVTISGEILPTPTPTPITCAEGCFYRTEGCDIKGIIARIDGTRMYLLPGDEIYDTSAVELWFCREPDAVAAGWRRWTSDGPAP